MALGQLKIPINKRQYFTVTGGPIEECPKAMIGVRMAKEVPFKTRITIPTVDFSVPPRKQLYHGLNRVLDQLLRGEQIYVGCKAGRGRTGLFLSILVKAFGIKNPVEFVRAHYYSHAVETPDQYDFVMKFKLTKPIKRKVRKAKLLGWIYFWQNNLTTTPEQRKSPSRGMRLVQPIARVIVGPKRRKPKPLVTVTHFGKKGRPVVKIETTLRKVDTELDKYLEL